MILQRFPIIWIQLENYFSPIDDITQAFQEHLWYIVCEIAMSDVRYSFYSSLTNYVQHLSDQNIYVLALVRMAMCNHQG